jgi:hypothetical protein
MFCRLLFVHDAMKTQAPITRIESLLSSFMIAIRASSNFCSEVWPANLLVVKLLVRIYKVARDGSREILLRRAGITSKENAGEEWIHLGGHDLVWILGTSLAADREGKADHGSNFASNMRSVPNANGPRCKRSRRRYS